MLTEQDKAVADRDTACPGLATLLDPTALVDALRAELGVDLRRLDPTYLRYKPATNCLAAYRADIAGSEIDLYAKAYRAEDAKKMYKAAGETSVGGPLGAGRTLLEKLRIVVFTFPNDDRIKALPLLTDSDQVRGLLQRILPSRPPLWEGTLVPLAYKPDRRFVARLDVDGCPQAVLKFFSGSGYGKLSRATKGMASNQGLRLPHRIGRSKRYDVLASEWLPGRSLLEALELGNDPAIARATGAALALLHAKTTRKLEADGSERLEAALRAVTESLAMLIPDQAVRIAAVAEAATAALRSLPENWSAIHGDFYAKQVIVGESDIGFIDMDTALAGHPAVDVGNFIAHLRRYGVSGRVAESIVEPACRSLLAGYRDRSTIADQAVAVHEAIGLLRVAPHPFRRRETDWAARTRQLVDAAAAALQRAKN